jgi:hypothetical protein
VGELLHALDAGALQIQSRCLRRLVRSLREEPGFRQSTEPVGFVGLLATKTTEVKRSAPEPVDVTGISRRVRGIGRTASLDSPYQLPARIQFAPISARATIPSARATIPARNNAALGLLVSDRRVSVATIEVALFGAVRPMAPNVTAGPMAIPVAGSVAVGRMRVFVAGNLINIPFFSRRLRK